MPCLASSRAVAAPNPLDAPRIRAHPLSPDSESAMHVPFPRQHHEFMRSATQLTTDGPIIVAARPGGQVSHHVTGRVSLVPPLGRKAIRTHVPPSTRVSRASFPRRSTSTSVRAMLRPSRRFPSSEKFGGSPAPSSRISIRRVIIDVICPNSDGSERPLREPVANRVHHELVDQQCKHGRLA